MTPRHRPPFGLRVTIGLLAVGIVLANGALMMSDQAPSLLTRLFGDTARRLSDRIDAGSRPRLAAGAERLASDSTVHVGIWAAATVLVALAIWTWRGLAGAAASVLAISLVVEIGQGRFSDTRSVERADALFNGVGVLFGVTVAAAVIASWSLVAGLVADRA